MNGFFSILEAAQGVLLDEDSALQTAAQTLFGRSALVYVGKVPDEVSATVPTVLLLDGDEDSVTEGPDRPAIGAPPRCRREMGVAVVTLRRNEFLEDLDSLVTAAITDLHRQPLTGARRVEYLGGGEEKLKGNAAGWTAIFHVLYDR